MPNCSEPDCTVRVDDEGMFCRIHQEKSEEDVKVRYVGEGIVQLAFGNFSKGTTARIPASEAEKLKSDKNWEVGV